MYESISINNFVFFLFLPLFKYEIKSKFADLLECRFGFALNEQRNLFLGPAR